MGKIDNKSEETNVYIEAYNKNKTLFNMIFDILSKINERMPIVVIENYKQLEQLQKQFVEMGKELSKYYDPETKTISDNYPDGLEFGIKTISSKIDNNYRYIKKETRRPTQIIRYILNSENFEISRIEKEVQDKELHEKYKRLINACIILKKQLSEEEQKIVARYLCDRFNTEFDEKMKEFQAAIEEDYLSEIEREKNQLAVEEMMLKMISSSLDEEERTKSK